MKKTLAETIKGKTPTLVVFQHAGSQDAIEVKYLAETLQDNYNGKLNVIRADVSHDGQLKIRYRLNAFPTWVLFKEGEELMRESGNKTASQLADMVQRAL